MINDFGIEVNGNNRRSFKQWINHTIRILVHVNVCVNIQKLFFFSIESLLCAFSSIERLDDDDGNGNGNGIGDEVPPRNMCIMFGERSMLYDIFIA